MKVLFIFASICMTCFAKFDFAEEVERQRAITKKNKESSRRDNV